MSTTPHPPPLPIYPVRGFRVVLDADIARVYGVATKVFNQALKRNAVRFPRDFAFQLTVPEATALRSQIVTSNVGRGGRRYRPWVFTEHGAVMAANILHSSRAIEMSVYVVRSFIKQREELATNATILRRLAEIDRTLLEHDTALQVLWKKLQPLITPPPEAPRRRIGFVP